MVNEQYLIARLRQRQSKSFSGQHPPPAVPHRLRGGRPTDFDVPLPQIRGISGGIVGFNEFFPYFAAKRVAISMPGYLIIAFRCISHRGGRTCFASLCFSSADLARRVKE